MGMVEKDTQSMSDRMQTARIWLGLLGTTGLLVGIILLIISINTTPLASAHAALMTLVCGSLLALIGSAAIIALLVIRSLPIEFRGGGSSQPIKIKDEGQQNPIAKAKGAAEKAIVRTTGW